MEDRDELRIKLWEVLAGAIYDTNYEKLTTQAQQDVGVHTDQLLALLPPVRSKEETLKIITDWWEGAKRGKTLADLADALTAPKGQPAQKAERIGVEVSNTGCAIRITLPTGYTTESQNVTDFLLYELIKDRNRKEAGE